MCDELHHPSADPLIQSHDKSCDHTSRTQHSLLDSLCYKCLLDGDSTAQHCKCVNITHDDTDCDTECNDDTSDDDDVKSTSWRREQYLTSDVHSFSELDFLDEINGNVDPISFPSDIPKAKNSDPMSDSGIDLSNRFNASLTKFDTILDSDLEDCDSNVSDLIGYHSDDFKNLNSLDCYPSSDEEEEEDTLVSSVITVYRDTPTLGRSITTSFGDVSVLTNEGVTTSCGDALMFGSGVTRRHGDDLLLELLRHAWFLLILYISIKLYFIM